MTAGRNRRAKGELISRDLFANIALGIRMKNQIASLETYLIMTEVRNLPRLRLVLRSVLRIVSKIPASLLLVKRNRGYPTHATQDVPMSYVRACPKSPEVQIVCCDFKFFTPLFSPHAASFPQGFPPVRKFLSYGFPEMSTARMRTNSLRITIPNADLPALPAFVNLM